MFEFIVFLHWGHDTQVHAVKATWSQKWDQHGKPWNQWFALTFNKLSECCGFAPDHWQPQYAALDYSVQSLEDAY